MGIVFGKQRDNVQVLTIKVSAAQKTYLKTWKVHDKYYINIFTNDIHTTPYLSIKSPREKPNSVRLSSMSN
jgi:hypothetical protein